MLERAGWFHAVENLLMTLSKMRPPDYEPPADPNRRPSEPQHRASVAFWTKWYEGQFGEPFKPLNPSTVREVR